MTVLSRRAVMAASLALASCGKTAQSQPSTAVTTAPPLKVAPFSTGTSVMTGQLQDQTFVDLVRTHFSQLTPEWEMKMEYILLPDGGFRFDAPDQIADFARNNAMRLHGHTLVWYAEESPAFQGLAGDRSAFAKAYDDYIRAVAGRYRGVARSWDVVNEPIKDDSSGPRESLWSRMLGDLDHIVRAYEVAAEADPDAVLFLNDYDLERKPAKRAQFMKLVERMLARGCPLGGLATQTHIDIDTPDGAVAAAIKDLASFGLPIHLSELDISTNMKRVDVRSTPDRLKLQADKAAEVAEAFCALPASQRFAFTVWGLRDSDSWLRGPNGTGPADRPALFDEAGAPKPAFDAVSRAFAKAAA